MSHSDSAIRSAIQAGLQLEGLTAEKKKKKKNLTKSHLAEVQFPPLQVLPFQIGRTAAVGIFVLCCFLEKNKILLKPGKM